MRLNLGKFEYNNKSGFILKPEVMRRVDVNKPFDPFAESSLDGIIPATVNVQVINTYQFFKLNNKVFFSR
jgi:phosphatidylinositol phospholipase C beta